MDIKFVPFVISNKKRHGMNLEKLSERGWGNGYVFIPKEAKTFHQSEEVFISMCSVHGGITFCALSQYTDWNSVAEALDGHNLDLTQEGLIVGFDTAHAGDTPTNWSKDRVIRETHELLLQIQNLEKNLQEKTIYNIEEVLDKYSSPLINKKNLKELIDELTKLGGF